MEQTQEEMLKETGGVMTSKTARGSPMKDEELTEEELTEEELTEEELTGEEMKEIVAGGKHNLNGDL